MKVILHSLLRKNRNLPRGFHETNREYFGFSRRILLSLFAFHFPRAFWFRFSRSIELLGTEGGGNLPHGGVNGSLNACFELHSAFSSRRLIEWSGKEHGIMRRSVRMVHSSDSRVASLALANACNAFGFHPRYSSSTQSTPTNNALFAT